MEISQIFSLCSLSILISYLPLSYLMSKLGIKWGLVLGYFIALIGIIIEMFTYDNIIYLYVGYFLVKLGTSSSIVARGSFAANWFNDSERIKALCIVEAAIYLGNGINAAVLSILVKDDTDAKTVDAGF